MLATISLIVAGILLHIWVNSSRSNIDETWYSCMRFEQVAGERITEHKQTNMEARCYKNKYQKLDV